MFKRFWWMFLVMLAVGSVVGLLVAAVITYGMPKEYLKTMKLKLLEMNLRHKMADSGVVIHDEAVIAEAPISPNVSLNLTLGMLLGFLLSPLMALPVIWVMNRFKPELA